MKTGNSALKGTVAAIMAPVLISVDAQDTVAHVERTLHQHTLSSVPVLDPGRHTCFGFISIEDICRFHLEQRNARMVRAWEVCRDKPVTSHPACTLEAAGRAMVRHRAHQLIVLDHGMVAGVLCGFDLLAAMVGLTHEEGTCLHTAHPAASIGPVGVCKSGPQ
jgi:CBS-domain-containing membrane protein